MLVMLASGEAQAFDIRETAPCLLLRFVFYIKRGWKGSVGETCKTCCSSARLGFMISPYLHMQMVKTKSGTFADEGLRHIFTLNGTLLKTGETCRNMKLAETLGQISNFGPIALYN